MPPSDTIRVKTEKLPVGSKLSHPINDSKDRLLLAAGVSITKRLKERLLARGINEVLLHPDDVAALFGEQGKSPPSGDSGKSAPSVSRKKQQTKRVAVTSASSLLQEAVVQIKSQASALGTTVANHVRNFGAPLSEQLVERGATPYDMQQRERLAQQFDNTVELLENIVQQALNGQVNDDSPLKDVALAFISELIDDSDNVIATSNEFAPSPTISQRGIRLSLLGMAMAIEMDWDEINVREVGLCGLVHDFGMFQLEEKLQNQRAELTSKDADQLYAHPLFTLELLRSMKNISLPVRLAATQIHENPDGSGYPRRLTSDEIHPYAHILHVADAYITLTAEMRGRQAYLSYDVMVYLLNQVQAKHMDDLAARALLQVVSLFPIGSHVRLSDGSEAQVIRRNRSNYTTPIVQRVGADRQVRYDSAHASIIDLAQAELSVMSPVVPPSRQETRLDGTLMSQILWDEAKQAGPGDASPGPG